MNQSHSIFADKAAAAGAEQCRLGTTQTRARELKVAIGIIVRDEKARSELRAMLGDDFGLILTIYESKGVQVSPARLRACLRSVSPRSRVLGRTPLLLLCRFSHNGELLASNTQFARRSQDQCTEVRGHKAQLIDERA